MSGRGKIDEFVFDSETFLPRLLSANASFAFGISNKTFEPKKDKKKDPSRRDEKEQQLDEPVEDQPEEEGILNTDFDSFQRESERERTKKISIPWSINFNLNYSLNRNDINNPVERFNVSTRASLQLTTNWKVSWNARLDITTNEIIYQNYNIYRDLHCWEMSLGWQPERGYYDFRINVKSNVLKDIKLTKSASNSQYIPRY
jgi:hypothetical protein